MMHSLLKICPLLLATMLFCVPRQNNSYVETESWDDVLASYESHRDSVQFVDIWNVNRALALTGQLADDAFKYVQHGSEGLLPQWNRGALEGAMLSDICYAGGHVALARRFAFEADICTESGHDVRMIKRLVQTNLITGAWDTAEKYISFLEREGGIWADWARSQRRFLHNDAAVDNDSEYGAMRRCIPDTNMISGAGPVFDDIKSIIDVNPSNHGAVEIIGTFLLLECDFETFRQFVDKYYGTEALPTLPESFAEAVCMMSVLDRGLWKTFGVSPDKYKEYNTFITRFGHGLSVEKYAGTYWYYVMRMNAQ